MYKYTKNGYIYYFNIDKKIYCENMYYKLKDINNIYHIVQINDLKENAVLTQCSDCSNSAFCSDCSNNKFIKKKVVVYLENWKDSGNGVPNRKSYDNMIKNATHIIVAFAVNYTWGSKAIIYNKCDIKINFDKPQGFDSHIDFCNYAKSINEDIKILMSYGGRNMGCCLGVSNVPNYWAKYCTNTSKTVDLIVNTMIKNHYDGIDIDWEVPSSDILYNIIKGLADKFKTIEKSSKKKPLLSIVSIADFFFPDVTLYNNGEEEYSYVNILKTFKNDIDIISIQGYNTGLGLPQIAKLLNNGIFSCMLFNNVLNYIDDPSKIVILLCNDGDGGTGAINNGCGWNTKGSNSIPNITVKEVHSLYYTINNNYGGLGIWRMHINHDNTILGIELVPQLKTTVEQLNRTTLPFTLKSKCIDNSNFKTSNMCPNNKDNCTNQCRGAWIGDVKTNPSIDSDCTKK